MIHDIFLRRYPGRIHWGERPTPEVARLFMQVAHIVFSDLAPKLKLDQAFFQKVHDALAREMGWGRLYNADTYDAICGQFLIEPYDLWNDRHGTADDFLKARLSLIELLFRTAEEHAAAAREVSPTSRLLAFRRPTAQDTTCDASTALAEAIRELNDRFHHANVGLHYHNGMLQFAHDERTEERIAEPCWSLLRDPRWGSVDRELKEALDRSDSGKPDAAFHAAKALESTIKIISDDQGWTTGAERGAANYIDNLVSQRNGRFIATWEAEILKHFFVHVRNPHGHGAGSQPPPTLADYQTAWAIESAMTWIKSLIRRL